ncbi:MAG: class IV adenylate cyclase [Acidobacteriota bacterium]
MTGPLEIEVKLPVDDRDAAARRIVEAGATEAQARAFEENVVFDFPDGRLEAARTMVRLRTGAGRALLTLKQPAGDTGIYKVRREVETGLDDPGPVRELLGAIGLVVAYRYQKFRTAYRAGDLLVTLDEVPIGTYIELEGSRDDIDTFARRLGYTRDAYINLSYRDLQASHLVGRGGTDEPAEMIFPEASRH